MFQLSISFSKTRMIEHYFVCGRLHTLYSCLVCEIIFWLKKVVETKTFISENTYEHTSISINVNLKLSKTIINTLALFESLDLAQSKTRCACPGLDDIQDRDEFKNDRIQWAWRNKSLMNPRRSVYWASMHWVWVRIFGKRLAVCQKPNHSINQSSYWLKKRSRHWEEKLQHYWGDS